MVGPASKLLFNPKAHAIIPKSRLFIKLRGKDSCHQIYREDAGFNSLKWVFAGKHLGVFNTLIGMNV